MAKSMRQSDSITAAATATDYYNTAKDISLYTGVCVHVVGVATGAGTLTVEISNDGINFQTLGTATITAGKALYNAGSVFSQWVRAKINLSAGTGAYTIILSAKDLG